MNKLKKLLAVGSLSTGAVVMSMGAQAAIDVSGAVSELEAAGTAAGTLIAAAIVFAGICMAGFALYRRIK